MEKNNFGLGGRKPDIEINRSAKPRKLWQRPDFNLILYLLFLLASLYFWQGVRQAGQAEIPYSEFLQQVDKGEVAEATITEDAVYGTLKARDADGKPKRFLTIPLADTRLAEDLAAKNVTFHVRHSSHWLSNFLLNWILPFGVLFLLWGWMAKRMGGMSKGFLNLGNKAHIHPSDQPKVTFADVAGVEEAKIELGETIRFLKDPASIQRLGGRLPKGVLLVGPPGTGKTLLARAVAGEAQVPFFNISGSEFIELFVGVGAARVREMFEQARQKAPCIIFIDELDAIGRARGAGPVMGGHDEREQTLNQLLTEMDGFDPSSGVVVMAATNRPEILDKALLRAGRFDRQIVVDKPDLAAREAILRLHTAKMTLAPNVDLTVVAQRTPGFVGADLANIANEAAILAVREQRDSIPMADFEAAIDRVIAGPEKKHRVLDAEEKRRVAFHESGHAIVAMRVPTGEPVHKVSIIPRGVAALGYTLQLPVTEKFLSTAPQLKDQIAILLGGRVAEELVLESISSGASNDLERASETARAMVTQLGMSEKLGPLTYGRRRGLAFLGVEETEERNYSEETARLIDAEVRTLVEQGRERAVAILTREGAALEAMAKRLQEKEVIDGEQARGILEAAGRES